MPWESLKQRARVVAGSLVYQSRLYRSVLPAGKVEGRPLRKRLYSYLQHYLATRTEAEAILFIDELGIKVHCDLLDHMLSPYLEGRSGVYEWAEIQHCKRYCQDFDYIVDVGANHGFWGLCLAQMAGSQANLILFEPNPKIAARLRKTLRANNQIAGKLVACAVAEQDGEADFYLPRSSLSGLGSTVLNDWAIDHKYLSADRKIMVPTVSLDTLLGRGELEGMDLLKIDVERAEDQVVAGGLESIKQFHPRLIMCETSAGSDAWGQICALGYTAYRLDAAGQAETLTSTADFWGNIFFTPQASEPERVSEGRGAAREP